VAKHKRKNKKIRKVMGIIGIITAVVLTIVIGILFFQIFSMNIIPNKYLWIVILFILMILGMDAVLCIPKIRWQIKLVFIILSILIILVAGFGIFKINDTMDFFRKIGAKDYEIEKYYVVVKSDSDYEKIEELKDKTIGVFPNSFDTYETAINSLNEAVEAESQEYSDLLTMAADLLNSKVDAILISDAHESVIEESYSSFSSSVRILYTIEVKTELDEIGKDAKVTKEPFIIYISGIDTYGDISNRSRSDVNMIMTINPVTKEILLVNVPRDYYVQLHGTTGLKDKLTHAGVYGINMSIQTMEDLLDIDINYYIRVNFNTLIDVVDVIGGITIDSDAAFTSYTIPDCKFVKGANAVGGKCALAFSRERYAYVSGDRHRGENQQQVITKIIQKLSSSKTIISKYSDILNSLEGSFQTNMETNSIYALIKMQLDDMPSWNINSISVDGTGLMTYTYSYPKQKLYVMVPTESTIENAKAKIQGIMEGKSFQELEG
jgi:LCP family protein required for cell wall assembly